MNILGVGPLELVLILLVMFLVLGPKDIVSTGKKLGRFLINVRKSEIWNSITRVNKTVHDLPAAFMRDAGLDEVKRDIERDIQEMKKISGEIQINDLNKSVAEKKASIERMLNQVDVGSSDRSAGHPRLKE